MTPDQEAILALTEENRRLREALESLLQRVRPGSEAAPWVIAELQTALALEQQAPRDEMKINVPNGLNTNPGDESY